MPSGWGDGKGHKETGRRLVGGFVMLAGHAGLDILSDIIAHIWPVIVGGNTKVSFCYAKVTGQGSVMEFM